MPEPTRRLTVVLPTYRRPRLLARLLEELKRQTRRPERLAVVDGEGGAGEAASVLERSRWAALAQTVFVPSTRANLPFQRWLGRRVAQGSDDLIFFDDDVLLPDRDSVANLVAALDHAAAATCEVRLPRRPSPRKRIGPVRLRWLRHRAPGSLTAAGSRRQPAPGNDPLPEIEWLRGPAMAFRCEALPPERFPLDLFALAETGAGMGEELALARRVRGRIVFVRDLLVEHPDTEPSRVLTGRAERKGFEIAYSRRLLNDLCRDSRPSWGDRAGLAWSWAGGLAVAAADATAGSGAGWAFARGYLRGVARGIFSPPTHSRLTPDVDWEREARRSLDAAVRLEEGVRA